MPQRILFTLKEDGTILADAQGFKGPTCLKQTEKLMEGLNAQCQNRGLKAEYSHVQVQGHVDVKG